MALGGLAFQDDGAGGVDDHLQRHHMERQQKRRGRGDARKGGRQGGEVDGDVDRDHIAHRLADVVIDAPGIPDGIRDGGKVIVHPDEVGRLAGDLAAPFAHGNADVDVFEGGASFTSSPAMATISPFSLKARTMRILCSGVTREKMEAVLTASRSAPSPIPFVIKESSVSCLLAVS